MLPQLASIHYTLDLVILVAAAMAVVRGIMLLARRRGADGWLRWPAIVVVCAAGAEALLGLILLAYGARPFDPRHYLWALAVLLAMPFASSFVRRTRLLSSVLVVTLAGVVVLVAGTMALFTGCPFLGGCPH